MAQQASVLCNLPQEVLEHIALALALSTEVGLPLHLTPLLSTCSRIYAALGFTACPSLYARIFLAKFDSSAPRRRLGPAATYTTTLAQQLRTYCTVLGEFREMTADLENDSVSDPVHDTQQLDRMLWPAFIMMSEDDGRNRAQLEWAGVDAWVGRYVRTRLSVRRSWHEGWLEENQYNSLVLWLMWMLTTEEKLANETEEERSSLIASILPYVVLACRYPHTYAPPNHFNVPFSLNPTQPYPHSLQTAHGPYPLYRPPSVFFPSLYPSTLPPSRTRTPVPTHTHYHLSPLRLAPPPLAPAARLLYFARKQRVPVAVPPHLPIDRADALRRGMDRVCITQADVRDFNGGGGVVLPGGKSASPGAVSPRKVDGEGPESERWDVDWGRWRFCWDPWADTPLRKAMYTPGTLVGLWVGRMIVPHELLYTQLITTRGFPASFSERNPFLSTVPLYMRFREHHCIGDARPVAVGGSDAVGHEANGVDEGMSEGWLPPARSCVEDGEHLKFEDMNGNVSVYETWAPGKPSSHNADTCPTCIHKREALASYHELEATEAQDDTDAMDTESESAFSSLDSSSAMDEDDNGSEDDDNEEIFAAAGLARPPSSTGSCGGSCAEEEDDLDAVQHAYLRQPCDGIQDIIITGETDWKHGQAWGHYTFHGRVRAWDGLVCLVRVPRAQNLNLVGMGKWVFTGYITGGRNFTGTWRAEASNIPGWEGGFVVSKRDEED